MFGASHLNATRTMSSIHILPNSETSVQSFVCVLKDTFEAQVKKKKKKKQQQQQKRRVCVTLSLLLGFHYARKSCCPLLQQESF